MTIPDQFFPDAGQVDFPRLCVYLCKAGVPYTVRQLEEETVETLQSLIAVVNEVQEREEASLELAKLSGRA